MTSACSFSVLGLWKSGGQQNWVNPAKMNSGNRKSDKKDFKKTRRVGVNPLKIVITLLLKKSESFGGNVKLGLGESCKGVKF